MTVSTDSASARQHRRRSGPGAAGDRPRDIRRETCAPGRQARIARSGSGRRRGIALADDQPELTRAHQLRRCSGSVHTANTRPGGASTSRWKTTAGSPGGTSIASRRSVTIHPRGLGDPTGTHRAVRGSPPRTPVAFEPTARRLKATRGEPSRARLRQRPRVTKTDSDRLLGGAEGRSNRAATSGDESAERHVRTTGKSEAVSDAAHRTWSPRRTRSQRCSCFPVSPLIVWSSGGGGRARRAGWTCTQRNLARVGGDRAVIHDIHDLQRNLRRGRSECALMQVNAPRPGRPVDGNRRSSVLVDPSERNRTRTPNRLVVVR